MYDKIIQERLAMLSPEYTEVVMSDLAEITTNAFAPALGLDEEKTVVFENGFLMFLLFFMNEQRFAQYLVSECAITESQASQTVADILAALPPDLVSAMRSNFSQLSQGLQVAQPNLSQTAPSEPEKEVAPTEAAPTINNSVPTPPPVPQATGKMVTLKKEPPAASSVKGMRTMRGDVNRLRAPESEK